MKKLKLTKGLFAIVDDEDFDYLNKWKWCADSKNYPMRSEKRSETGNKKRNIVYMHRELMKANSSQWVDHIDGNVLNNQKSNLRYAVRAENQRNRKMAKNNKSGYKGVWFDKRRQKFVACLKTGGRTFAKRFDTAIQAAEHYNKMASEKFGEFARLNDV